MIFEINLSRCFRSKFLFLNSLQNRNEILFYHLVHQRIREMLPLIYTPTVGTVSLEYSSLYVQNRGLHLPYPLKNQIPEIIQNLSKNDIGNNSFN